MSHCHITPTHASLARQITAPQGTCHLAGWAPVPTTPLGYCSKEYSLWVLILHVVGKALLRGCQQCEWGCLWGMHLMSCSEQISVLQTFIIANKICRTDQSFIQFELLIFKCDNYISTNRILDITHIPMVDIWEWLRSWGPMDFIMLKPCIINAAFPKTLGEYIYI